jgi:hypothetical protein
MAKSFLTDINLNNNVLLNAKIQAWGSTPTGTTNPSGSGTAVAGQLSSYNGALYIFNGTAWVAVGSAGTITSVTGTSPVVSSGGTTPAISLASGYGDTQNPYASKTANYVLAAPNGSSGAPTFRALVAADIPTLNQNTTGSAATLTTARTINGTSFDGSANITVTAAAGTLTGSTLASGVTASSLTSVGTLTSLTTSGSVTVGGDLIVNGTTTTVNSTTITVDDKNLELGSVASPDNTTADGGGITLKGTTDKTFNWVNATSAWTSSEDLNLLTGKVYEIAGTTVLSATTLGSGVVNSSLTSVGTIATGTWNGSVVAGQYGGTGVANTGKTITLGGNFTTSGAYTTTLTVGANTNVTLPASGTLMTTTGNTTGSAATLTTSRTLWGQSFNGSANVTGAMTGVTSVTGTSGSTFSVKAGDYTSTSGAGNHTYVYGGQATAVSGTAKGGNVYIYGGGSDSVSGTTGDIFIGGGEITTVTGTVRLPSVQSGSAGFVKIAATTGQLSTASIAYSDLPTNVGVVARKVSLVGTGSGTTIALTHGLGTNLVTAQVYDTSTSTATLVETDITVTSTVATATFAATTTLSNYTLVVIG